MPNEGSALLQESALALAERIRSGRTSSLDIVEAHIERIRAVPLHTAERWRVVARARPRFRGCSRFSRHASSR